jgi:integrase
MAGSPNHTFSELNQPRLNEEIINFAWHLKKLGRTEQTIKGKVHTIKQLSKQCNINNTEEVKTIIATSKWCNATKNKIIDNYTTYLEFKNLKWIPPHYEGQSKLPFIPTEQEIDQLIASCGFRMSALLQTLKETGVRIGEAVLLKWIDLDTERRTLNITPEKGSNPRILPISEKLLGMLNRLPRERETIFRNSEHGLRTDFDKQRKTATEKLNNPRIKKISFHTFRHFKGTMEYHQKGDIEQVKRILGHKNGANTFIYINIEQALFLADANQWIVKIAHNEEEESKLIEQNFIFINKREEPYTAFYKKRK